MPALRRANSAPELRRKPDLQAWSSQPQAQQDVPTSNSFAASQLPSSVEREEESPLGLAMRQAPQDKKMNADPSGLPRVGKGTSGAAWYTDETQQRWVVKRGSGYGKEATEDAMDRMTLNEVYASKLYAELVGPDAVAPEGQVLAGPEAEGKERLWIGSKEMQGFADWEELMAEPEFTGFGYVPKTVPEGTDKLNNSGLATSLAAARFLGDHDVNKGNIGAVTKDEDRKYTKIDYGHAFDFTRQDTDLDAMLDPKTLAGEFPMELMDEKELEKALQRIASLDPKALEAIANEFEPRMDMADPKEGMPDILTRLLERQTGLQERLSKKN